MRLTARFFTVCLTLLLTAGALAEVVVNDRTMTAEDIQSFTLAYGTPPVPGRYWYDARSGLYGNVGGPALGQLAPGQAFGELKASASGGDTGVFVNGRELPAQELAQYKLVFGDIQQGRYWMDANGNAGPEGESTGAGGQASGSAPAATSSYTDREGYTWQRYVLDCQLQQGNAQLHLDVSTIDDAGIVWDTSKPNPEISGVIGMDQKIRYLKGEFRLGGQAHRFTGRGSHFSFRETLDNSQSGRFELRGSELAVYYPFDNPQPGICRPAAP